jgi:hypothetical protein
MLFAWALLPCSSGYKQQTVCKELKIISLTAFNETDPNTNRLKLPTSKFACTAPEGEDGNHITTAIRNCMPTTGNYETLIGVWKFTIFCDVMLSSLV